MPCALHAAARARGMSLRRVRLPKGRHACGPSCVRRVVADVFLGAKRGDPTAGQAGFHEMGAPARCRRSCPGLASALLLLGLCAAPAGRGESFPGTGSAKACMGSLCLIPRPQHVSAPRGWLQAGRRRGGVWCAAACLSCKTLLTGTAAACFGGAHGAPPAAGAGVCSRGRGSAHPSPRPCRPVGRRPELLHGLLLPHAVHEHGACLAAGLAQPAAAGRQRDWAGRDQEPGAAGTEREQEQR